VPQKKIRILLTGGGTGGHIYPLIAVAQQLQKKLPEAEIRCFGAPDSYYKFVLENRGIEISKIAASKLRRYFSLGNFWDFFKFFWGLIQSFWKIFWFMPDAAFSKGGPGALPIILACRWYQIPIFIHESDAAPGLTNKISAKYAKKIFLAFEAAREYFEGKIKTEIAVVGQPVREDALVKEEKEIAKRLFSFNPQMPVILVLGGSQGSSRINDFILENLETLLAKFQIIHQIGRDKYDEYKNGYDFISQKFSQILKNNYQPVPYLNGQTKNLRDAFNAADLVISRAGAGAIFETAARGIPAILIPLPESANGHQKVNAYEYAGSGAGIVIEEENLLPHIVIAAAEKILSNREAWNKMSEAARKFYQPDAAEKIAAAICEQFMSNHEYTN
jgi:UDP-N-acetylglucosamine--N-acetylmuramyl-(pentapeptide) pyrophosphoryl-undecaprenol N-acetylglucosamine transferase